MYFILDGHYSIKVIFVPKYVSRMVFKGGILGGVSVLGQSVLKQYDRTVWYVTQKILKTVDLRTTVLLYTIEKNG